jgi:hypothetical protein
MDIPLLIVTLFDVNIQMNVVISIELNQITYRTYKSGRTILAEISEEKLWVDLKEWQVVPEE